ncbi:cobalamin-dependent protein [Pseudoponticoccus marisrubri]|uniref:B12-binding domain-containing protein n=1 Tax=Pseudoponticoccus marisrubri TaxID=1685382 RepID=A0A0W7WHM0_9RHOB|nr:cobalamin-dependent protein [Pseudoponticoccus marisrubri]KUF10038.1 hypothetical protein AVJ23_14955 [Pseudoponticoccus marisrubri]
MHGDDHTSSTQDSSGKPRLASFARQVLGEVSQRPGQNRSERHDAYGVWLADFSITTAYTDRAALDELERRRMSVDDLILQGIPRASALLGHRWMTNELSFARVSLGSARLFGLCRSVTADWSRVSPLESGLSVLLCTIDFEDHLIGASVLAYKLRKAGHSVRSMTKATPEQIVEKLDVGSYDCLMLSASTLDSLASIERAVKHVRTAACVQPTIILGGAILSEVDGLKNKTGVDLVTSDINTALGQLVGAAPAPLPKVAE